MWFWLSIAALLCWSGSDLFSKLGCSDENDKTSHLKMVTAVGIVMGLHCAYEVFICHVQLTPAIILGYLPVSACYILSMAIGYLGLRYIELSISSPICNSSGALVALMTLLISGIGAVNVWQLLALLLVSIGVIAIGIIDVNEDDELRLARQKEGNRIYTKSLIAILIPIIYCIVDALGTYADSIILQNLEEESANAAYELTFFAVGVLCFIYVKFIKKSKFLPKKEAPKYIGACFETLGQFAYVFAIADTEHVIATAPIVSAYCAVSVLWGRLFLKEKLSKKHYLAISLVIIGIIIIGIFD